MKEQTIAYRIPPRSLVLGFDGKKVSDSFVSFINEVRPFGIIFFERNFSVPTGAEELIKCLRSIDGQLEFLIDQEGGDKCRISGAPYCPPQPWMMRNWKAVDIENEFFVSAEALAQIGFTINLAPVADLGTGEYIKKRTLGENAEEVAEKVASAVRGIVRGGLKPCAKHFPGLGSANDDPHRTLPVADVDAEEFDELHWLPFRAAIDEKCPFVMTTHLLAPSLDEKNPATYSKKITKILRKLGFSGKILSDDLAQMTGAKVLPTADRIGAALESGHDIALWCSEKLS